MRRQSRKRVGSRRWRVFFDQTRSVLEFPSSPFVVIAMSLVSITNIGVLDNPSNYNDPFRFEITFECVGDLVDGAYLLVLPWFGSL